MTKIIIMGCPRSGTTALRDLLNTQHNTYLCNELAFYSNDKQVNFMKRLDGKWWKAFSEDCIKDGIDPDKFRSYIREDKLKSIEFLHHQGYEIVGDKFPSYVLPKYHTQMLDAEPNGTKFIFCIRDCRAFISSSLRHYKNGSPRKHWVYCTIHEACAHWVQLNRGLIQLTHKLSSKNYIIVKYEDAVHDKEKLLKRIHKLTNNKWYGRIKDASDYYPVNVDAWKTEYPKIDHHLSEDALRLMELYGYNYE